MIDSQQVDYNDSVYDICQERTVNIIWGIPSLPYIYFPHCIYNIYLHKEARFANSYTPLRSSPPVVRSSGVSRFIRGSVNSQVFTLTVSWFNEP